VRRQGSGKRDIEALIINQLGRYSGDFSQIKTIP